MFDIANNEKVFGQLVVNKIKRDLSEFQVKIVGNSMYPTIKDGETVSIHPIKKKYEIGDIICFLREKQYLIVHRIVKIIKNSNKTTFITQGDNMEHPDVTAVMEGDIVGHYVEKDNRTFIKVYYFNKTVNIVVVSNIMEIIHFIASIFPNDFIDTDYPHRDNKTLFSVHAYKNREKIIIEVYSNFEREIFQFDNMANANGHIYSILFNSDDLVKRERVCFHAGVVKNQYHNIILIGGSGQGKSTLLYELTNREYMYAGDEKLFVCVDKERVSLQPCYTPIMLREDYARKIPIYDYVVVNKGNESEKKYPYVPKYIFDNIDDRQKQILVIPSWNKENKFVVKKLSKIEVVQLLLENVVNLNEITKDIKLIATVASKMEGYHISYSKIGDVIDFLRDLTA